MDLSEAINKRHSVRSYTDKKIEGEMLDKLKSAIEECNKESGLHIQLVLNEPKAFSGMMARYGKFSGVMNYIAMIGPKGNDLEEKVGYYGERLVLLAQQLGLNTCWVAMTYSKVKSAFVVNPGEKLSVVIAIGYGAVEGVAHKPKAAQEVSNIGADSPEWFKKGIEAALLAPTAMNQQKFKLTLNGNKVSSSSGSGFYTKLDLGIVKYHFELGAGKENFVWEQ